jgi:hypothetical protein
MTIPIFTLRTVTSGGALNQFLPDFQGIDISPVFSAAGTIQVKYPENGVNFSLLQDDLELAICLNGVEVPELRCVVESTEGNDATDQSNGSVWTFTCRTLLGRLDQAIVYPQLWPTETNPPKQEYQTATPGEILGDLITKAHTRGSLLWLSYDFTDTLDSAGQPWANSLDIEYDAGTTYLDVVDNLYKNGAVEVTMQARVLRAYNPDTLGTDKSIGATPLRFVKGRDMSESPRKSSTRELSTVVLVAGKNNSYVERVADSGSLTQWGRRELSYSVNNVETPGVLDVIGDTVIETLKTPRLEVTHGLHYETDNNPKPITDFTVGDWGLSDVGRGFERYRIKQWVVSVDDKGAVTGSVTLNQLIDERITKLNRKLTELDNGTTSGGASEQEDDGKAPAVPTGFSITSNYYIVGNQARAVVTFNWSDVTTNSDGTTLSDLEGYTARWRYASDAADLWRVIRGTDANTSIVYFDDINPNSSIRLQVEAHDRYGRSSGYSALQSHTTAGDTTAPAKTSSPVVTSNVGTLRVVWDGLNSTGGAMDADLAGVEVHVGPNGTFTPDTSTLRDYLVGSSKIATTITAGLSYGTEYWVRLVPVDTSGNRGAASDETSTSHVVLSALVNVEIGTGEVGLSNTRFSDVGNLVDDGNFENQQLRGVRTVAMTGTHFSFDNTTASVGTWSVKSTSYTGADELLLLQSALPVKPGERIFGAADFKSNTSVPVTAFVAVVVKWLNAAGNYIDNTGIPNNVYYQLANNWNTTVDNAWHSRVAGTSVIAPTNAVAFEVYLANIALTAGLVWTDAVEIRRQVDTLLVADLAVTNAKIANLAVNNAKISDLSVGKLTTGTLGADIVVGARIKTSDTGARVELNSAGIAAYNSGGTQTVNIASSDGSVTIIGTLKSGVSGRRVEVNPTSTFLPELRFYPTTGSNYAFINSIASGSGTVSFMGVNTGQFTANGQTCQFRNYMTDTVATVELIRSDTQAQWGGGIDIGIDNVYINHQLSGTSQGGYADIHKNYAEIGFNSSTDANDVHWYMNGANGEMRIIGRFAAYVSLQFNEGLHTGILFLGGASGISVGYGATMNGNMAPGGTMYDDTTFFKWKVGNGSATGYDFDADGGSTGAWIPWTYRMN